MTSSQADHMDVLAETVRMLIDWINGDRTHIDGEPINEALIASVAEEALAVGRYLGHHA